MNVSFRSAAAIALIFVCSGCAWKSDKPPGPTEEFNGRLLQDGSPPSFAPELDAKLNLVQTSTADSWGIPLTEDGQFKITWMPVDTYHVYLVTANPPFPDKSVSLGKLEIVQGQKDYTIEYGKKEADAAD